MLFQFVEEEEEEVYNLKVDCAELMFMVYGPIPLKVCDLQSETKIMQMKHRKLFKCLLTSNGA